MDRADTDSQDRPAADAQKKLAVNALGTLKLHDAHQKKVASVRERMAEEVRNTLRERGAPATEDQEWPALASAAEIVIGLDHTLQNQILAKLPEDVREQMVERLYSFASIPRLSSLDVQKLIRSLDPRTLAISLIGGDQAVKETITANMSSRARTMLEEDIESLTSSGELSSRDLREARSSVSRSLYELYESGKLGADNG